MNKKWRIITICLAAASLLISTSGCGPGTPAPGQVRGILKCDTGEPLSLNPALLKNPDPGGQSAGELTDFVAEVNEEGEFLFENVPPGKYGLVVISLDNNLLPTGCLGQNEEGEMVTFDLAAGKGIDLGVVIFSSCSLCEE